MSIKWKPKADGYFFKKFLGNLESKNQTGQNKRTGTGSQIA